MKPEIKILKKFFKEDAAEKFLASGWLELWELEDDNTKRWLLQQLEEELIQIKDVVCWDGDKSDRGVVINISSEKGILVVWPLRPDGFNTDWISWVDVKKHLSLLDSWEA